MIRIAIVEDEKVYAEEIADYCRRYSAEKKTEISSRWFDNPVDFLEKYHGDVELPDAADGWNDLRETAENA